MSGRRRYYACRFPNSKRQYTYHTNDNITFEADEMALAPDPRMPGNFVDVIVVHEKKIAPDFPTKPIKKQPKGKTQESEAA